jgi:hypothetical protein
MRRIIPLTLVFCAFASAISTGSLARSQGAEVAGSWEKRLLAVDGKSWREGFSLALELASLPAEEGAAIAHSVYPRLRSSDTRRQILKGFYYTVPYPLHARLHPRILDILHLGMEDEDGKAQEWARDFLKMLTFRDFEGRGDDYRRFREEVRGLPLDDVVSRGLGLWMERTAATSGSVSRELDLLGRCWSTFRDVPAAREAALELGFPERLFGWAHGADAQRAVKALRVVGHLRLGEELLRQSILPLLEPGRLEEVRTAAAAALEGEQNGWAVDALLGALTSAVAEKSGGRGFIWACAGSLGRIGEKKVIPHLVALIELDGTYDTVYGVGYFGLWRLTGVSYDESHDGVFWRSWWEENRGRFGGNVAELEIPALGRQVR